MQAWIYPGSPAHNADEEYRDGRKIHVLKPEYYTVNQYGNLMRLTVSNAGENAYSAANAANVKAYSQEQYVTVSANQAAMSALVRSSTKRTSAKNTLVSFVRTIGFTGVELDWEGYGEWTATDYTNYKTFVKLLGNALHMYGKKLIVDGPPIGNTTEQSYYRWRYEDFEFLPVNQVVVMAYDANSDDGAGTPVSPAWWMRDIAQWVLARISNPDRIAIGIPAYGYHGPTGGWNITIDTKAQSALFPRYTAATRDPESYEMRWTYNGISYFFQDTTSLNFKRQLLEDEGIRHVSVWHLGGNAWFTGTEPN